MQIGSVKLGDYFLFHYNWHQVHSNVLKITVFSTPVNFDDNDDIRFMKIPLLFENQV